MVIPYLERCVYHAAILSRRAEANREVLGDLADLDGLGEVAALVQEVSETSLDYPELCQGIEATLRTMVLCSFRAPRTRIMFQLLNRFNPTASLLRMKSFVARHDYIFTLLLLLNVNMGAFDVCSNSSSQYDDEEDEELAPYFAYAMLYEVSNVFQMMSVDGQRRVLRRIEMSGALPVARDTASYQALLGILWGGGASQLQYLMQRAGSSLRHGHDLEGLEDAEGTKIGWEKKITSHRQDTRILHTMMHGQK